MNRYKMSEQQENKATYKKCSICGNTDQNRLVIPNDSDWFFCQNCAYWTDMRETGGKTETKESSSS